MRKNNSKSDVIWIGNYFGFTGKSYDGWVIGTKGMCYTMLACMQNGNVPKIITRGQKWTIKK